jgi:hypothetical protein
MKSTLKFILMIFTVLLLCDCDQSQSQIFENGFLEGKITIGPLCPVETDPPDPACQPTQETYNNWPIVVWTSDKKMKIATIKPELDGNFLIDLPEGSYVVDLDKQHMFGKNLPATIIIEPDKTVLLNIDIDTGIR